MSHNSFRKVLLVENNAGDARLLREMFNEQISSDNELTLVECMSEAEKHLAKSSVDIILLDLGLPDAQGLESIRRARVAAPNVPLVVLTGRDDEALAASALQEGAQDYLIKGEVEARGLLRVLSYAIERKRLGRLKDEFIASVSHELRTPLTSICGSLGLLTGKAGGDLPSSASRLIAIAHTSSQRLVRLVNDILDIEKIESGFIAFNWRRVEVRPLIEETIEANRGFADGYHVPIRVESSGAIAAVRADPDRLAQVITNLLSNAIKYSPPDHEVVVTIENCAGLVRISFRDHGPGIPPDFRSRVFEKFAQADTTNARQKGGTGLGLSIVKQIVDQFGGEIGFDDVPGGGTIFRVELPSWERVAGMTVDLDAQRDAARILLCEDDLDTAVALREQLRQVGFATDFAHTAGDALASAVALQYLAVLVDLQLPDRDGISLILHLRALPQYRDTPIIVLSADPNRGRNDARSSKLDVLDWLNKPVDFDRLMRVLLKSTAAPASRRPRILHVDEHNLIAQSLSGVADVVSVGSIAEAQRALHTRDFDLAVVETAADDVAPPELRNGKGHKIPVIIFSDRGDELAQSAHVPASTTKSGASLDSLMATVREHLVSRHPPIFEEIA